MFDYRKVYPWTFHYSILLSHSTIKIQYFQALFVIEKAVSRFQVLPNSLGESLLGEDARFDRCAEGRFLWYIVETFINHNGPPPGNNTGWWFGTFFIFPYIGNNDPNWRTPSFFRGVSNTHGEFLQESDADWNIQSFNGQRWFILFQWVNHM